MLQSKSFVKKTRKGHVVKVRAWALSLLPPVGPAEGLGKREDTPKPAMHARQSPLPAAAAAAARLQPHPVPLLLLLHAPGCA